VVSAASAQTLIAAPPQGWHPRKSHRLGYELRRPPVGTAESIAVSVFEPTQYPSCAVDDNRDAVTGGPIMELLLGRPKGP